MGQPKHAKRYCGNLAPSMTCLTDETTLPYEIYGLQQGKLAELISPSVVAASVRALARGSSQGKTIGDAKMLPGTFIVDQQGIIQYAYYSQHAGDHPRIDDLIEAANALK
jgi:peroxiredoxin